MKTDKEKMQWWLNGVALTVAMEKRDGGVSVSTLSRWVEASSIATYLKILTHDEIKEIEKAAVAAMGI